MSARRAAGWAVLSLIPVMLVALAILAGQVAEAAVGMGIGLIICGVAYVGFRLLFDEEQP